MDKQEKEESSKVASHLVSLIDENRVLGFTDAVFAFAATLLVLKIDLPAVVSTKISTQLTTDLIALWPQYLANIISFLIIGFYWLNHHAIFGLFEKFDRKIVWMNIIFLIALSFLPFPIDLYGDNHTIPVVIAFYSLSLSVVGFMLLALWLYGSKNLVSKTLSKRHRTYYTCQYLVAPAVFLIAAPLAFIHPLLAHFAWLFVIVGLIVVGKMFHYKRMNEIERLTVE